MLKNTFTWRVLVYFFVACVIVFNFLDFNITLAHTKLEYFFDSDMLYLHRLYMDVFFYHHHFLAWNLTPAPYFFPDMLIFFILEILSEHNIFFCIIAYGVIQYALLLFLSQKIATALLKGSQAYYLIFSVLLLTLIFLVIPAQDCYRFAIRATYHFSEIINGLILLLLLFYLLQNLTSKKLPLAIGVLSLLSSASDPLFMIQFCMPVLLLMLIIQPRLLIGRCGIFLLMGILFGCVMRHYFSKNIEIEYMYFDPLNFYVRLKVLINKALPLLLQRHHYLGSATLAFYVALIIQLAFQRNFNALNLLRLFIVISVFATLLCVSLVETNGSVFQRYILNFYFFSLVFCWLPFASILERRSVLKIVRVLFIFSIGVSIYLTIKPYEKWRWEYYPLLVTCVDDGIVHYNKIHNEHIQYGIASYWQAGVITSLSKTGLRVTELDNFLKSRSWINNPEMLRENYDFAVIALPGNRIQTASKNILSISLIEKNNGKPTSTFQCNNEAIIMIYGENKLHLSQE